MNTNRSSAQAWLAKWRWYHRDLLPWRRVKLHREIAAARAFARMPLHGEPLEMFRSGRLEVGPEVLFEPFVWLTGGEVGVIRIGEGAILNINVMVASMGLVEIGKHTMVGNGCVITDADHKFDDPDLPVTWQGFTTKGPTRVGDNCWLGANVVVTSGVTIGERAVIGAGSVVTKDIPSGAVAVGAPAKVIRVHS